MNIPKLTFWEKWLPISAGIIFIISIPIFFLIDKNTPQESLKWVKTIMAITYLSMCLIVIIFRKTIDNATTKLQEINRLKRQLTFTDKGIKFGYTYPFKHSSLRKNPFVLKEAINEVTLSSYLPSLVINNQEVIFIPILYAEKLKAYAQQHNLPISDRVDIWGAITFVFLDIACTEEELVGNYALLAENGLPKEEVKTIRKRIEKEMLWLTMYTWEWMGYSHYDVLKHTIHRKSFYWYSMDIALRNYLPKE